MIDSIVRPAQRHIPEAFRHCARIRQLARLQKQVHVVLRPPARIGNEMRAVRKTLEHREVDRHLPEFRRDFLIRFLDAFPSLLIPREITHGSLAHSIG